jgi:uncharacterized membrane protein (Fun14 family)
MPNCWRQTLFLIGISLYKLAKYKVCQVNFGKLLELLSSSTQQFGKPTWHPYNFGKTRKIGLQQFGKPTWQI